MTGVFFNNDLSKAIRKSPIFIEAPFRQTWPLVLVTFRCQCYREDFRFHLLTQWRGGCTDHFRIIFVIQITRTICFVRISICIIAFFTRCFSQVNSTNTKLFLTLRRIREPTDLLKEQLPESLSINFFKFITPIRVIEINSWIIYRKTGFLKNVW